MVTLVVLVVAVLAILIATALITLVGGAGFILAFGDLLVCGLIIRWIIRVFKRKN